MKSQIFAWEDYVLQFVTREVFNICNPVPAFVLRMALNQAQRDIDMIMDKRKLEMRNYLKMLLLIT